MTILTFPYEYAKMITWYMFIKKDEVFKAQKVAL